jgi:hypothetical protein
VDKVLLPKHFMKFLVANLMNFSDNNTMWTRLIGKAIPRTVEQNPAWIDLISPSGSTRFNPAIWYSFFKAMRCHVSPHLVKMSRYLALFVDLANMHGINVTVKNIFPIFVLRLLAGKNAAAIAADRSIAEMMYRGSAFEGQAARERMDAFASKLLTTRWMAPVEEENALVMLMCASTFRGAPFLRRCYRDGMIPVIQTIPRYVDECISSGDVGDAVGCNCGPHEEKEKEEPQQQQQRPTPMYVAFPGGKGESPSKMLSLFNLHSDPLSKNQMALCEIVAGKFAGATDAAFSQIVRTYAKMMGFAQTVDAWAIIKSIYVALLGGEMWLDSHKVIVPEHVQEEGSEMKYALARNELSKLTLPMVIKLMESIDATRVKVLPAELAREQLSLASRLSEPLAVIPKNVDYLSEFAKMVLAIYMVPGNNTYENTDLWKELQFMLDNKVQKAIDSMRAEMPELSGLIRALVMASVTASSSSVTCKLATY